LIATVAVAVAVATVAAAVAVATVAVAAAAAVATDERVFGHDIKLRNHVRHGFNWVCA
jgi:uncharacterized membrane protein